MKRLCDKDIFRQLLRIIYEQSARKGQILRREQALNELSALFGPTDVEGDKTADVSTDTRNLRYLRMIYRIADEEMFRALGCGRGRPRDPDKQRIWSEVEKLKREKPTRSWRMLARKFDPDGYKANPEAAKERLRKSVSPLLRAIPKP